MKRPPVPRPRIYDLYWYFASERQQMFARRVEGEPGPWTDDPILREFKFCNVFRAADRVSQYMIRDVCYHDEPCTPTRTGCSRSSRSAPSARPPPGGQPATSSAATRSWTTWRTGRSPARWSTPGPGNGGLYTGAFILCATDAYGQSAKHRNHVELFRHMFLHDQLGAKLLDARSLREVYGLLHGYPLMGDFMSYQTTIDLNYSALIGFSENEFTQAGPGALRGIKKCFSDLGDYTPAEIVLWMTERQDEEFARLGLPFGGLWGRPLHAIDCQGLFCETDKYCREAAPELASARKRIKARFTPTPEPIRLFFPPKWGINDKLPSQPVLSDAKPAEHEQAAPF